MTIKFAVVGSPINHSLSPQIHLAAYKALGLDFSYERLEISKGNLRGLIREGNYSGFSVTMPLKEEAMQIADVVDEKSKLVGNSNTLVLSGESWQAFNTDIFGVSKALAPVPSAKSVLIIGTGATSRAITASLSDAYPNANLRIWGRSHDNAEKLEVFASKLGMSSSVLSEIPTNLKQFDLVVSGVPASTMSKYWQSVDPKSCLGWLLDVSYSPWPSDAAAVWGKNRVISGIEMLKWQAIEQIRLFASAFAPGVEIRDEIYEEMTRALDGRV